MASLIQDKLTFAAAPVVSRSPGTRSPDSYSPLSKPWNPTRASAADRRARPGEGPACIFSMLLTGAVFRAESHHHSVRHGHILRVGRMRIVLGPKAGDSDDHTGFEGVLAYAAPVQGARRGGFERPACNRSIGVFDVDVNPRVRIGKIELGHRASDFDFLVAIVFRRERVVGQHRSRRQQTPTNR